MVHHDIDEVLLTAEQIDARIREMGRQIAQDLDALDQDAEVVLVPILTGAIVFLADLVRHLPLKLKIDVVTISSYPGTTTSSKGAALVGALPRDGGTVRLIREELARHEPATLQCCVLLRKTIPPALATPCEYVGFDIPDKFVVGFGLDYDHYYRNLPYIGTLKPEAI
jgi:hypoxanthine phosphoribosyltransferase